MSAAGPEKKEKQDELEALKAKIGPKKGKATLGVLSRCNNTITNIEKISESIPIDKNTARILGWTLSQHHTPDDVNDIIKMSIEDLIKRRDALAQELGKMKEDPYLKDIDALRQIANRQITGDTLIALQEKKDGLIKTEQQQIRNEIIWDQLPGRGALTNGSLNYLRNLIKRFDALEEKLKLTNAVLNELTPKKGPAIDYMQQAQQKKAGPMSVAAPQQPAPPNPQAAGQPKPPAAQPKPPEKPKLGH